VSLPSAARLRSALLIALAIALLPGCASSRSITRRNGSTVQKGRFIPPEAYAWYARGLHEERNRDFAKAEHSFLSVLSHDEHSGAAWAGLIRLRCDDGGEKLIDVHRGGTEVGDRPALAHEAMAQCLLQRSASTTDEREKKKLLRRAVSSAKKAMRAEPASLAAHQILVDTLRAGGKEREALQHVRSFRLFTHSRQARPVPEPSVDDLLRKSDLTEARSRATGAHSPGELAARALALGKIELAKEQATLVVRAAPGDADSVAVLHLLGHDQQGKPSYAANSLSLVAAVLVSRQLKRIVGADAARNFLSHRAEELAGSNDPLVHYLFEQLQLAIELPRPTPKPALTL